MVTQSSSAAPPRSLPALERLRQVRPGCPQGRRNAERQSCQQGDHEGERQHPRVRLEIDHDGVQRRSKQPRHEFCSPRRQQKAERATTHGEQPALRQQLADDPLSAGAKGHPDREFARPRGSPHQQQTGNIRAGDQQHDGDHRHEGAKRSPITSSERIGSLRGRLQRCLPELSARRPAERLVRRKRHVTPIRGSHSASRLDDVDIWLETCHQRHARPGVDTRQELGIVLDPQRNRQRDVDLATRLHPDESCRCDADNRDGMPGHRERLAQHVRTAAEATRPIAVTDHRNGRHHAVVLG